MKFFQFNLKFFTLLFLGAFLIQSCDKDDPIVDSEDPVSSFQFEISETNFLEVTFSNFSSNANSYSWNFGDGNSSTDENPIHTYSAAGNYTVELTAMGADNKSATSSKTFTITDPNSASKLLTGEDSKTWKLFREGTCLSLGPDASNPAGWWSGLSNDGARPCLYSQTFTFHTDGKFVFDDMGMFWGENDPWNGTANHETCFEPTAANMVNLDGADVSAWGSGEHQFSYDPSAGTITLNGMGAWMGLVQAVGAPDNYSNVPTLSRTFNAVIVEETGYDLMTITYDYGADGLWTCVYVSYSDTSLEPAIETDMMTFGTDLPDQTPTAMFNTFASTDAADVDQLVPTASEVTITPGVDDPADAGAAKVGEYIRGTGLFSDLKFQLDYDCQFDNFTTMSIDVYLPSSNVYADGGLQPAIQMWIADASQTEQFWTNWVQYDVDPAEVVQDEWKTYTWPLGDALTRADLDLVGLVVGGSNHSIDGTFYVRNLVIE
jgi:PKD repeat protein